MRTTLVIEDSLLRRAKIAAAKQGATLSDLVERALREALREVPGSAEAPFVFPTYGAPSTGRARKGRTPAELKAALAEDEESEFRRTSR